MARTPAGRLGRHPSRVRAGRVARTAADQPAPSPEEVVKVAEVPDLPQPTIEEVRAWAADEVDQAQVRLMAQKAINSQQEERIRELEARLDFQRQEGEHVGRVFRGMRMLASLRWLPDGLTRKALEELRGAITNETSTPKQQENLLAAQNLVRWVAEGLIQDAFPGANGSKTIFFETAAESKGPEPT